MKLLRNLLTLCLSELDCGMFGRMAFMNLIIFLLLNLLIMLLRNPDFQL